MTNSPPKSGQIEVSVRAFTQDVRRAIEALDNLQSTLVLAQIDKESYFSRQTRLQRERLDRVLEWAFNQCESVGDKMPTNIPTEAFFKR